MNLNSKIYVAGHKGMVGSAIVRNLESCGFTNLVYKNHGELDLTQACSVADFFMHEQPEYVFLAAAKVGGIHANENYPVEFFLENSLIYNNVLSASYKYGVSKLLFLGSSCIYPRNCPQPIKEEYLLTGELEVTNEAYALAKISGLKLCEYYKKQYGCNFISCMPTNIYGRGDNFDLKTAHVLPALLRKFHEEKSLSMPSVEIWGTGSPLREFLHVDDLAKACVFLMENYDGDIHVNIGSGQEVSIKELALMIKDVVGYEGRIVFNASYKDGTPRKLLDTSVMENLGWQAKFDLGDGIRDVYSWYKDQI